MTEIETTTGVFKTHTLTLVAGTLAIGTQFQEVYDVIIQQNTATVLAESFGWTAVDGTVTIKSSNGASTAPLRLLVRGRL